MADPDPKVPDTWETASTYEVPSRFDDVTAQGLFEVVRQLEPGSRLPNERDLALQLGVSRTALRDRVRFLETAGLLSRRRGSGTYVEETVNTAGLGLALELMVSAKQFRLLDLHQVRVALETQAAFLAAVAVEPNVAELANMQTAVDRMHETYGTTEFAGADLDFHAALIKAAQNPALEFFADALHGVFQRAIQLGTYNWSVRQLGKHMFAGIHQDILDAIVARDPQSALQAMNTHFVMRARTIDDDETSDIRRGDTDRSA